MGRCHLYFKGHRNSPAIIWWKAGMELFAPWLAPSVLFCKIKHRDRNLSFRTSMDCDSFDYSMYIFCFVLIARLFTGVYPANAMAKSKYLTGYMMVSPFHLGMVLDKWFCVAFIWKNQPETQVLLHNAYVLKCCCNICGWF